MERLNGWVETKNMSAGGDCAEDPRLCGECVEGDHCGGVCCAGCFCKKESE